MPLSPAPPGAFVTRMRVGVLPPPRDVYFGRCPEIATILTLYWFVYRATTSYKMGVLGHSHRLLGCSGLVGEGCYVADEMAIVRVVHLKRRRPPSLDGYAHKRHCGSPVSPLTRTMMTALSLSSLDPPLGTFDFDPPRQSWIPCCFFGATMLYALAPTNSLMGPGCMSFSTLHSRPLICAQLSACQVSFTEFTHFQNVWC